MCGRITLTRSERLRELFRLDADPNLLPRFNIAPTQPVAAVRDDDNRRELVMLHWGLIPPWAKDPSIGARMINARAETAADKPAFRNAFKRRRCLVVADGFYEWQKIGNKKQPHYIHLADRRPFGLGGLWEKSVGIAFDHRGGHASGRLPKSNPTPSPHGNGIESCTILTVAPNALLAGIHDRMPLIVPPDAYDAWLDPATPLETVQSLLKPFPTDDLRAHPVSTHVNSAKNDDPACIEPLPDQNLPLPL